MVRGLINNADLIAVLSKLEKQTLIERYGPKNFYVLPNAVEGSPASQVNNRSANDPIELVFMGRINKTKGIFVLAEALKQLSGYHHRFSFTIYGAGPDLPQFMAQLAECPQLNYAYRGVAKGYEKWQVLHQADVLLLPSIHSEGMPMVILESMAGNCLVISTDDASICTVITDGINGLIVPKSDPAALAAKIRDVLDGHVDRFALAAQGQALIAQHYTMAQYLTKLKAAYQQIARPAALSTAVKTA
jgi:glycosyltransferase involved in cell wall biosynthesis